MSVIIRPIAPEDNAIVGQIIRTVMPEFGAGGEGFAIHDDEVDDMFSAYHQPGSAYFLCEEEGKVLGGAGIGPLSGGDAGICELRKMYLLPEGRGRGLGQELLTRCIETARRLGYSHCYVETFNTMTTAMAMYERNNFLRIPGPLGNTGHFACDCFYLLDLHRVDIAGKGV